MHFSILKFSILIHQHKDLQRCNICRCYAIHFLIESKNYFIGSQPSLTVPKDKLKNSTYSFTLVLKKKKKVNLSIVVIYLKYIIFKWLYPQDQNPQVKYLLDHVGTITKRLYIAMKYMCIRWPISYSQSSIEKRHLSTFVHPSVILVSGSYLTYRKQHPIDYSKVALV